MIKIAMVFLLTILPYLISAQGSGVKFEDGLTWEQIKQKARSENKYIFMDCFATWCGPCKKMDKETYPSDKVGFLVNQKFVSVKVQMDSTREDNDQVRNWYGTIEQIKSRYKILGYPTYLFFSPEGELVHQDDGYKNEGQFVSLINTVLVRSKQLMSIIEEYKKGKRDAVTIMEAARAYKKFGQNLLGDSIARSYKIDFLDKLGDINLFTKENIRFVAQDFAFLIYEDGSKGRFFKYFYEYPTRIDSITGRMGYASFYVTRIIKKEELVNVLFPSNQALTDKKPITKTPEWNRFKQAIAEKYNITLADSIISDYKPEFYKLIDDWHSWATIMEAKLKGVKLEANGKNLGGYGDDWMLNYYAWDVFEHCNDRKVVKKALKWTDLAINIKKKGHGIEQYFDTKANLLYKLGRTKEAIEIEEKALSLNQQFFRDRGLQNDKSSEVYAEAVRKMKSNIPTWKIE